MNLNGKVAVITGASGGIGSATARNFAAAGCKAVVGYDSRAAGRNGLRRRCLAMAIARPACRWMTPPHCAKWQRW